MTNRLDTLDLIEKLIVGAELRDHPPAHGVKALALYLSERDTPCRVLEREVRYRVHEQDGVMSNMVHALEIPSQCILIDLHQKMDWGDILFRVEWDVRNSLDETIVSIEYLDDIGEVNPAQSWGYDETMALKATIERVGCELEGNTLQRDTAHHKGAGRTRRI